MLEEELPATLNERQENLVQMQKVAEMTIEPGVMRLPVTTVTTADNSEQWVIEVEHPVEGEHRFFREKPVHGWHSDQELVQLLHWYGIYENDPYMLQVERLYVRYVGKESDYNHGWELLSPDYFKEKSRRGKIKERTSQFLKRYRPERGPLTGAVMVSAMTIISFSTLLIDTTITNPIQAGVMLFICLLASIVLTGLILPAPE